MIKTIVVVLLSLLALYLVYRTVRIATEDKAVAALLGKGAVILDVRTAAEFATGHIPGAVNVPLSKLRSAEIPADTADVVITCCSHGLRSVRALERLRQRGYRRVYNGGAWSDLQLLCGKKMGNNPVKPAGAAGAQ